MDEHEFELAKVSFGAVYELHGSSPSNNKTGWLACRVGAMKPLAFSRKSRASLPVLAETRVLIQFDSDFRCVLGCLIHIYVRMFFDVSAALL